MCVHEPLHVCSMFVYELHRVNGSFWMDLYTSIQCFLFFSVSFSVFLIGHTVWLSGSVCVAGGFRAMGVPLIVKDSYTLEGTLKEVTSGSVTDCRAMAFGKRVQGQHKDPRICLREDTH